MSIIIGALSAVTIGMIVHHFTMQLRNSGQCEINYPSSEDRGLLSKFKMTSDEDISTIIKYLIRERLEIGSELILKPFFHDEIDPFKIGIFFHGYQIGWIDEDHRMRTILYQLLIKKTAYSARCTRKEFSKGKLILNNPFGIHEPQPEIEIEISAGNPNQPFNEKLQLSN